jgi:hypothetical protein
MKLDKVIEQIKENPEIIEFQDIMTMIDEHYIYTASDFSNGPDQERIFNKAGENEGSCKIFSFAQLHQLNMTQTLNCFGRYYREDVVKNPEGSDHANIRTFDKYGWSHITFDSDALKRKTA